MKTKSLSTRILGAWTLAHLLRNRWAGHIHHSPAFRVRLRKNLIRKWFRKIHPSKQPPQPMMQDNPRPEHSRPQRSGLAQFAIFTTSIWTGAQVNSGLSKNGGEPPHSRHFY